MKLANLIFSTNAKIDALRTIYFAGEGISGRRISLLGEINPRSCQLALQELIKLGVLSRDGTGKAHKFYLNRTHPLYEELLMPMFEGERKLYRKIGERIIELLQTVENGDSLISIWGYEKRAKGSRTQGLILLFGREFDRKNLKKVEKKVIKSVLDTLSTNIETKAILLNDLVKGEKLRKITQGAVLRVIFGEKPGNIAEDLGIKKGPIRLLLSTSFSVF